MGKQVDKWFDKKISKVFGGGNSTNNEAKEKSKNAGVSELKNRVQQQKEKDEIKEKSFTEIELEGLPKEKVEVPIIIDETREKLKKLYFEMCIAGVDLNVWSQNIDSKTANDYVKYKALFSEKERKILTKAEVDIMKWSIVEEILLSENLGSFKYGIFKHLPYLFEKIKSTKKNQPPEEWELINLDENFKKSLINITYYLVHFIKENKDLIMNVEESRGGELENGIRFLGIACRYFDKNLNEYNEESSQILRDFQEFFSTATEEKFIKLREIQNFSKASEFINEINDYLEKAKQTWNFLFSRCGLCQIFDLYELVYSVLDYEIDQLFSKDTFDKAVKVKPEHDLKTLADIHVESFKFFKSIEKFSKLTVNTGRKNIVKVKSSIYEWFHLYLYEWLKINKLIAKERIERSMKLDKFETTTNDSKISSSALDTAGILRTIIIDINWPEICWNNSGEAKAFSFHVFKSFEDLITDYCKLLYDRRVEEFKINEVVEKDTNDIRKSITPKVLNEITKENINYISEHLNEILNEFIINISENSKLVTIEDVELMKVKKMEIYTKIHSENFKREISRRDEENCEEDDEEDDEEDAKILGSVRVVFSYKNKKLKVNIMNACLISTEIESPGPEYQFFMYIKIRQRKCKANLRHVTKYYKGFAHMIDKEFELSIDNEEILDTSSGSIIFYFKRYGKIKDKTFGKAIAKLSNLFCDEESDEQIISSDTKLDIIETKDKSRFYRYIPL